MTIYNYGAIASNAIDNFGQGLEKVAQRLEQKRNQEKLEMLQGELVDAYRSNDPDKIAELSIQNPQLAQVMSQALTHKNERTEKNFTDTALKILQNPENAEQLINDRLAFLTEEGADTTQTQGELAAYQSDPEGYADKVKLALAYKNPAAWNAYKETLGKPTERTVNYQNAGRGVVFDPVTGTFTKSPAYDSMVKEEAKSKAPASGNTPEQEETLIKAKDATWDALSQVDNLLSMDLDSVTGYSANFPTLQPSSQDVINTAKNLQNILTLDNMGIMKGVLTDKDMEVIANAASGLNISESGIKGSTEEVKNQLRIIKRKLESKLNGYRPGYADEVDMVNVNEEVITPYQDAQSGYGATAINNQGGYKTSSQGVKFRIIE